MDLEITPAMENFFLHMIQENLYLFENKINTLLCNKMKVLEERVANLENGLALGTHDG